MIKQGDIIRLDFNSQAGNEQKGIKPALVVSNDIFNKLSKIFIVCPITHTDKKHPFHISLDNRTQTNGIILCDQARNAKFIEKLPEDILDEVINLIKK